MCVCVWSGRREYERGTSWSRKWRPRLGATSLTQYERPSLCYASYITTLAHATELSVGHDVSRFYTPVIFIFYANMYAVGWYMWGCLSGAAHHLQCRRVCVSVSDKHRIVLPNLVRISFFFKCLMRIEEITRHTTAFRISKAHSFPIERNAIFEMAIPRIFPICSVYFFPSFNSHSSDIYYYYCFLSFFSHGSLLNSK